MVIKMEVSMNISRIFCSSFWIIQLLCFHSIVLPHGIEPVSYVQEIITQDELHTALTASKPTVVLHTMEHCPHCKVLKPQLEALASKPEHQNKQFFIANGIKLQGAKMLGTLSNGTVKVPGYPTTAFVNKGKIVDHQIGGNIKGIEDKVKKLK